MAREECKALLDALARVTACHRHLVLSLGGSADSPSLRRELKQTRQQARDLAAASRARLTAALRDRGVGRDERADLERLWVIFSSSLEVLDTDMRRALELAREFPLNVPRRPLVQTGLAGGTAGVAARAGSGQSLKDEAERDLDEADLRDLEREIRSVGEMMYEMEMKVSVPRWAVEARQDPGAELHSAASASSGGFVSVQERKGACDVSRLLAAAVFSAVLIVAVILAVCVAKLS